MTGTGAGAETGAGAGTGAGPLLRVADLHPACRTLGPGSRFVVWVQGCPLNCRGCVSPQWIPANGGTPMAVSALAERIAAEAADGLTLSGGEPFAQAGRLASLVDAVRARRDLSVMSYTGWTLEHLRAHGTPAQRGLLDRLDLLVDGPYVRGRHGDLRWRGSANQRVHHLTERHRGLDAEPDTGAGLQIDLGPGPTVRWAGVPRTPDFRVAFEAALGLTPPAVDGPSTEGDG